MRIAIVAPHTFPIPPPTYSGEVVIYDLARSLDELGHRVDLYAPQGSWRPPHGNWFPMPCSYGASWPTAEQAEQTTWDAYKDHILQADVVHDFSHSKRIAEIMGGNKVVSTLLSSLWDHPSPPLNIVVWSQSMRDRGLRGATDYENTSFTVIDELTRARFNGKIKDAHVVPGGTDTDYYVPDGPKQKHFLWLNRWHPAKGYQVAIELARRTGVSLVLAGLHPEAVWAEDHRRNAQGAVELAKGLPNVRFEWLPREPPAEHHGLKRSLYQKARALIYSVQFQEPFGLAQVEALACGTPVIATNFGSVSEVIEHGRTGFVCNNMDELAQAVERIDSISPEDCHHAAVARFDRLVMARAYLAEYRCVVEGKTWGT